jgi:hypothetical protein
MDTWIDYHALMRIRNATPRRATTLGYLDPKKKDAWTQKKMESESSVLAAPVRRGNALFFCVLSAKSFLDMPPQSANQPPSPVLWGSFWHGTC